MDQTAAAAIDQYRALHARLREIVKPLDLEAATWTPGPDTSSIATLVIHMLGSEREILKIVRGLPSDRDRAAEFVAQVQSVDDLTAHIDRADAALAEDGEAISDSDVAASRNNARRNMDRSGLYWLVNNYGHACEHWGQIQLTAQMFEQRRAPG